jgi:hypothetical protein
MANRLVLLLLLVGTVATGGILGGCGKQIGDACVTATDCSSNGDRLCDTASSGGYCTIRGCDYSTCPDEAVCVRFFTGSFTNRSCADHPCTIDGTPNGPLALDELCSVAQQCVTRSSELRYCMKTCDSDGDCRDDYECRDLAKMQAHGGEPVLAPNEVVDSNAPKFCAAKPGAAS